MSKRDSYLAIFAISILTTAIAVLVYYLLRVHVPPEPVHAEEAEDPRVAARRAQREAARRQREDMLREQEEKRAALEEKQAKREEERLRKEQAEIEKKLKEYNRWKSQMSVVGEKEYSKNEVHVTDEDLVDFIRLRKRVTVDQVSLMFGLSLAESMKRLMSLNTCEAFQGVVDDRGIAIYITDVETNQIRQINLAALPTIQDKLNAVNSMVCILPNDGLASSLEQERHADEVALDLFIS